MPTSRVVKYGADGEEIRLELDDLSELGSESESSS